MNATQRLIQIDLALAVIPTFACEPGCSACCGPVLMSRLEWKRICDRLGYEPKGNFDAEHLDCPMLKDGRCSVYDIRPAICRLFGAVDYKMLECPKGRRPERLMPEVGARQILRTVEELGR